jgi:superfamily I DNA/RNA helicase
MWLVPLEALTEDQLTAVQRSRQGNQVIIGGPGSGKTLVLIHRAHRHISDGIDQDRIKVLVYTNVLVDYLKSSVAELGMSDEIVSTFDKWCMGLYRTYVKESLPRLAENPKVVDYEQIRVKCLEALEIQNVEPWLDSVLVDEGQDLSIAAIKLVNKASKHVTLALDTKQQLYQVKLSLEDVCQALDVKRASATLLTAYRCTPLIVDLAAAFLSDPKDADAFKRANLLPVAGVETPVVAEFDSDETEFDELAKLLGERALLGQESAVLLPSNYLVGKYAKAMQQRGLTVVVMREDSVFGELKPMFMTYHSAKGLTVDSVFLPGLSEDSFKNIESPNARETLLFVGITRATHWVWLGQRSDDPLSELDVLMKLGRTSSIKRKQFKKNDPEGEINSIPGNTSKAQNLDELLDLL